MDLTGYFCFYVFDRTVAYFELPGCRINMSVETAAKAQVTLQGLLDTGYMGLYISV